MTISDFYGKVPLEREKRWHKSIGKGYHIMFKIDAANYYISEQYSSALLIEKSEQSLVSVRLYRISRMRE